MSTVGTWFGWAVPAPLGCVQGINSSETVSTDRGESFWPVAFSFMKDKSTLSMIFCYSKLEEHDVVAYLTPHNLDNSQGIYNVSDRGFNQSFGLGPNG